MKKPFILLIDTTVLYSGLVYSGLERKILTSGKYVFVTTDFVIAEIYRLLRIKAGLSHEEASDKIKFIPLIVVKSDFLKYKWDEACTLIGYRDRSDVHLVALALSLHNHDGIWSTDKDFQVVKDKFKVWKTRELM